MIRFGDFSVSVDGRELRRGADAVHLEPQAFDLLAYLITHRDRVVPNPELLDQVWGAQFFSPAALTTRIKEIRRAVGDDGVRQAVIRNVRGRGYRFVAEVDEGPTGPPPGDGLIGRRADLAAISVRLAPGSLVTVVGPGGVGKSTLARAVVGALGDLADGVVNIDLSEIDRAEALVPAIGRAAGVVARSDERSLVTGWLRSLDAVVVLDGAEHVIEDVARLAREVLGSGRVRMLVTSRERLGVPGEQVWPLLPLSEEAALHLFWTRARDASPQLGEPSPAERDRVAGLLAALDRLPLAIEMAAAQVAWASLSEIDATVRPNPLVLQSPDRGAHRRHRSLAALVEWSVELLAASERDLLERMAVLAGPLSFDDLRGALVPTAPISSVAPALARLVESSLVVAEPHPGGTRYRQLETVRAVAAALLEVRPDRHGVQAGHARWVADAARQADRALRTEREPWAVTRFEDLSAELRAAHRWAVDHEPPVAADLSVSLHLFSYSRLWHEPATWARALLDADAATTRDAAHAVAAADAASGGRLAEARYHLDLARSSTDPRVLAVVAEVESDVCVYTGHRDALTDCVRRLDEVGAELDDAYLPAIGRVNRLLAAVYAGDREAIGPVSAELAAMSDRIPPSTRAWHGYGLAEAETDPSRAIERLEELIATAEDLQARLLASVSRTSMSIAAARLGDHRRAFAVMARVLSDTAREGNYTHAITTVRHLLPLLIDAGRMTEAVILHAAVGDDRLRPSYGADAELLSSVAAALSGHVGAAMEAARGRGGAMSLDDAVRLAAAVAGELSEGPEG